MILTPICGVGRRCSAFHGHYCMCSFLTSGLIEGSGQSEWELLSVVDNSQRGSLERRVEKLQYAVSFKLPAIEELVRQAEGERDRARMEKREAEGERDRMVVGKREAEGERDRVRVEKRGLEVQLQQAQRRANELQVRLDEVEGREHERVVVQEQAIAAEQRGPSWEVRAEDLQSTEEVLGIGGWAEVRVAHLKCAA